MKTETGTRIPAPSSGAAMASDRTRMVAAIGLALGGIFGMVGTMLPARNLQAAAWAIDGLGIIVATALLALRYFRKGNDLVAAGFLVFAIGESVMLAGTAAPLAESGSSFVAGIALWTSGLLLISLSREFGAWVRIIGIIAAVLFAITAAKGFWGQAVLPTTTPLPFYAYPFVVLTFAGWIWTLLRSPA